MLIFTAFTIIAFVGILTVAFLVFKDTREPTSAVPITPEQLSENEEKIVIDDNSGTDSLLFSLKDKINNNSNYSKPNIDSYGSESLTTKTNNNKYPNLNNSNNSEEYKKLDQMLSEKNETIKKYKNELENEKKNRMEFDKVKSLLEEELQTLKNNIKALQQDLKEHNTLNQNNKNRISDLEQELSNKETEEKQDFPVFNSSKENAIKSADNIFNNSIIDK